MFSEITIKKLFELIGFELLEQNYLLGGINAFLLRLDKLVGGKMGVIDIKIYRLIRTMLWADRELSYFFKHGPIITFFAREVG